MISISQDQRRQIVSILRRFLPTDCRVVVFGSRLGSDHHQYSDLDICVIGEVEMSDLKWSDMLQTIAETDLPFKVDLSRFDDLPASFQEDVRTRGIDLLP